MYPRHFAGKTVHAIPHKRCNRMNLATTELLYTASDNPIPYVSIPTEEASIWNKSSYGTPIDHDSILTE